MLALTCGTFDIFHYGHARFLKNCYKIADSVIVSLNTDEFIDRYKGSPPIMTFNERKEVLEHQVDVVVKNVCGEDSKPVIDLVKPDFLIIGDDWAKKDYYKQMGFTQEWLDERGILLCYTPYTHGISTTDIKRRING